MSRAAYSCSHEARSSDFAGDHRRGTIAGVRYVVASVIVHALALLALLRAPQLDDAGQPVRSTFEQPFQIR
jgi:hypothetical protein